MAVRKRGERKRNNSQLLECILLFDDATVIDDWPTKELRRNKKRDIYIKYQIKDEKKRKREIALASVSVDYRSVSNNESGM